MSRDGLLPPGCTEADVDRAAPDYDEPLGPCASSALKAQDELNKHRWALLAHMLSLYEQGDVPHPSWPDREEDDHE